MRNFFSFVTLTFLLVNTSGCAKDNSTVAGESTPAVASSSADQVMATVNGKQIKESEFKAAMFPPMNQGNETSAKVEEFYNKMSKEEKRRYLDAYIDQQLIRQEGEKNKVEDSAEFKSTMSQVKEKVIFEIIMIDYLKDKIKEEDVKKYYDDYSAKVKNSFDLKLSYILVKTEAKANEIKDSLSKGQKFADLAKKFSEDKSSKAKGGDLGFLSIETMARLGLVEGVYNLKKGEVSNPISTEAGWSIVKVEDKRTTKIPSYEQAKDEIQRMLIQQLQMQYLQNLRSNAKIEIKLD
ncbi:MAG: peptidylprolyl isomerase [Rickettsiaceae bacterium]|nr:peptidylprolyl isomerase [Rickettsiaceae bacterium]